MKRIGLAVALTIGLTLLPVAAWAGGFHVSVHSNHVKVRIHRPHQLPNARHVEVRIHRPHIIKPHHVKVRMHQPRTLKPHHDAFKRHGHVHAGFHRRGFVPHFAPRLHHHGFHHRHFAVRRIPRGVWVPGFWHWNGFRWVWVRGHWRWWPASKEERAWIA